MTKKQKMELRNKLRAKFIEKIERRISRDVENEGLKVMSDYLSSCSEGQEDQVLAFIKLGERWSFAQCISGVDALKDIYSEFGLTNDVMSFRHFVTQYNFMYASEAVRAINEWRERNGVGVETAY